MKIKTGGVGYNNKILISDEKFSLGKNEKVNSLETPAMKSHKYSKTNSLQGLAHAPNIPHKNQEPHNKEKIALVLFWQVVLLYGICFNESQLSLQ